VSVPVFAQARRDQEPPQRGGPPGEKTPYILVTTFSSTDRKLGVESANEMRHRLQQEHSAKELYVVPKTSIDNTLAASGYPPDSALNSADLMELSKQLHGEYVLDSKVTKTGPGDAVRFDVRVLLRAATSTLAQPLPAANGKDPGDAAKMVERSISEMLKGIPMYRTCIDDLRAQKNDEAATAARAGIAAYPNSVLSRICLLNAYTNAKAPADSIISVANAILQYDPMSMLALVNLADAYAAKGDKDKAIETNLKIYRVDPSNTAIAQSIVQQLGASGAPDKAIPIIDSLIKDNPADVGMLRTKWVLQLNAKQFKNALITGDELIKLDTAAATVDFYNREIGAAQSDSNATKTQELAAKASQKFPKDPTFPLLLAQSYYKSGQLQQALDAARRSAAADPKSINAWKFILVALTDLKQNDSALAAGKRAIASGIPADSVGDILLGRVAGPAIKAAQASKTRADWDAALKASQAVDSITPSPQSAFYIGVSSFQVASDIMNEVQPLTKGNPSAANKAQACTLSKQAEDYLAITMVAMPRGGRVDAAVAGQILGAVTQYTDYIGQIKKAFACK
jgi:tetratricopeptide (TPR) repeat protein